MSISLSLTFRRPLRTRRRYDHDSVRLSSPLTQHRASAQTWAAQPASAQSQVTFVPGNFLAPTLEETKIPQGKPTYLIRHVLHDWTDDEVVAILKNVRAAMTAGRSDSAGPGTLLLCEMLLRPASSRFVRTTSMQLLALNDGVTRTDAEMVKLVETAGFEVRRIHDMRAVDSIIEATPNLDF